MSWVFPIVFGLFFGGLPLFALLQMRPLPGTWAVRIWGFVFALGIALAVAYHSQSWVFQATSQAFTKWTNSEETLALSGFPVLVKINGNWCAREVFESNKEAIQEWNLAKVTPGASLPNFLKKWNDGHPRKPLISIHTTAPEQFILTLTEFEEVRRTNGRLLWAETETDFPIGVRKPVSIPGHSEQWSITLNWAATGLIFRYRVGPSGIEAPQLGNERIAGIWAIFSMVLVFHLSGILAHMAVRKMMTARPQNKSRAGSKSE